MNKQIARMVAYGLVLFMTLSISLRANAEQHTKEIAKNVGGSNTDTRASRHSADKEEESKPAAVSVEDRLKKMEEVIERQQCEIQALREQIEKQKAAPLTSPTEAVATPVSASVPTDASQTPASGKNEAAPPEAQKRIDELYKRFGSLRFSGDLRFRAETFRNQGFDALAEAPDRNRLRVRARLALDGTINSRFDWGVRLASGIFTDPISSNQTLTDFYERKPFALERAFIRYDSKGDRVGVQLVAGKFEPTFRRTQMVWDDDISVEGASEAVYFKTKTPLRQVKFVAFQLPFNEVSGGKDGVLYGGQAQTDWQFAPKFSANFNVGYYDWNHADQIVPALGALATQVNGGLFNGSGMTGNQNGALGTTNRLVRNAAGQPVGFLAGFNLVDVLGNFTWAASGRFPMTFLVDFVHNATDRVRDEKDGYWVGAQVGQTKEKGDWLFGYTFTRIEQDAVLVPFNFSDILASNSRAHMSTVAYQIANGVTVQWTGLFSQRVNRVVTTSPFARYLNRMQFDVIYKF
ncbi:MAG TPA: putative porin [Blastocatellia bacterium]|nr:putative porin [Blastocatellia bacterium]